MQGGPLPSEDFVLPAERGLVLPAEKGLGFLGTAVSPMQRPLPADIGLNDFFKSGAEDGLASNRSLISGSFEDCFFMPAMP
jgi:hypothetical protein